MEMNFQRLGHEGWLGASPGENSDFLLRGVQLIYLAVHIH